ncbi:MAG: glutathione S-transferase N-terminal domain-containing protein [Hyphomicrobiales bacterium]
MVLVGQYDSPFVRRVAVTLNHYGIGFTRQVLSVFGDFDQMLTVNPLGKVPSLALEDGESLFDSRAILEELGHEGGFDLVTRQAVRAWIARVEARLGIAAAEPAAA